MTFGIKTHSTYKPSGYIITTPLDNDKVIHQETVMCVHCGRHWVWQAGSGRRRGFCMRCNGVTCGSAKCDTCMPLEKWLDVKDSGKNPDSITVPVGACVRDGRVIR